MKKTILIAMLVCAGTLSAADTEGVFKKVWERRFCFDNEVALAPDAYLPAAHYSMTVKSFPAAMEFREGGKTVMRFAAPERVAPPYVMHLYLTCAHLPGVYITKDGKTWLDRIEHFPKDFDPRRQEWCSRLKYAVAGGAEKPAVSLTAGIGQGDFRWVTTGKQNTPYCENGRYFFTFGARGYGSVWGVMSVDPEKRDFRLSGIILFDYGDGILRNDVAGDLFYDEDAKEWRTFVSNFSTGNDQVSRRAAGGLNVGWSKQCPLKGCSIMRAKSLGLTGMNEDPDGYYDVKAGKWRLLVSEFAKGGIRASMLESDRWDGGFKRIAGPVDVDSTGTTIALIDGELRCLFGSANRKFYSYTYPDLRPQGELKLDQPPWNPKTSMNGRVWPAYLKTAAGKEYLLTFDRVNFPGMPRPNWTYGKIMLYER